MNKAKSKSSYSSVLGIRHGLLRHIFGDRHGKAKRKGQKAERVISKRQSVVFVVSLSNGACAGIRWRGQIVADPENLLPAAGVLKVSWY